MPQGRGPGKCPAWSHHRSHSRTSSTSTPPEPSPTPTPVPHLSVAFILDASGSMSKALGGTTRLAIAQDAITELSVHLPRETNAGPWASGHRVEQDDKAQSCQDIDEVIPLGPVDAAPFDAVAHSLGAKGIRRSRSQAAGRRRACPKGAMATSRSCSSPTVRKRVTATPAGGRGVESQGSQGDDPQHRFRRGCSQPGPTECISNVTGGTRMPPSGRRSAAAVCSPTWRPCTGWQDHDVTCGC